jgi:hypothetical protein
MRAILRKEFGGPDVLEIREIPEPEPKLLTEDIAVKISHNQQFVLIESAPRAAMYDCSKIVPIFRREKQYMICPECLSSLGKLQ